MVVVALHQNNLKKASLKEMKKAIEEDAFFESAMEKLDQLNDRESELNHSLCDLQKELADLEIFLHRLEPEVITQQLLAISSKMQTLEKPSTVHLQKQFTELKRHWKHLQFLQEFPVANELTADSFQNNLAHRVSQQIEQAFKSRPQKVRSLKRYLSALKKRCQKAEAAFCKSGCTQKVADMMTLLANQMMSAAASAS